MSKLCQILAIDKQTKAKAQADLTKLYQSLQKPEPLKGISRTYTPKDDEGEKLPQEIGRVQIRVSEEIKKVVDTLVRHCDLTGSKELTNTVAKADIVVDGKTLAEKVPATYLLFLEKMLVDLVTMTKTIPVLDTAESWTLDKAQNLWATDPVQTARTKKVMKNHVKAEATDKHPAQVETYTEDVVVGYWKTIKYSGAMSRPEVDALLVRLEKLQNAVKFAREEANSVQVLDLKAGKPLMDYIFGTL